jgi:hypothetical protein
MSKRSALSGAFQEGLPTVNAAWWPPGTPLITWGLTGQSDLAGATWEVKPLRRNGMAPGKKKATRELPWRPSSLFLGVSSWSRCCFRVITDANIWLPDQWFEALTRDAPGMVCTRRHSPRCNDTPGTSLEALQASESTVRGWWVVARMESPHSHVEPAGPRSGGTVTLNRQVTRCSAWRPPIDTAAPPSGRGRHRLTPRRRVG